MTKNQVQQTAVTDIVHINSAISVITFIIIIIIIASGSSQARGWIRAAAASYSHSNTRSKPHLWPTPELREMINL